MNAVISNITPEKLHGKRVPLKLNGLVLVLFSLGDLHPSHYFTHRSSIAHCVFCHKKQNVLFRNNSCFFLLCKKHMHLSKAYTYLLISLNDSSILFCLAIEISLIFSFLTYHGASDYARYLFTYKIFTHLQK